MARLNHARRDPEFAHREVDIGFELHTRRCQERIGLALRMLGEVLLELGEERVLIALELLAVVPPLAVAAVITGAAAAFAKPAWG